MNEVTTQVVSETPIETKLCPYRKSEMLESDIHQGKDEQKREQFAPCLQEKCAMWRDKRFIYLPTGEVLRDDSYCGLAGKP